MVQLFCLRLRQALVCPKGHSDGIASPLIECDEPFSAPSQGGMVCGPLSDATRRAAEPHSGP